MPSNGVPSAFLLPRVPRIKKLCHLIDDKRAIWFY
jgi:hypothetical protein